MEITNTMEEIPKLNKTQVCKILKVSNLVVSNLLKRGVLKRVESTGSIIYISAESVFNCKKEMDERKNTPKPVWINRNEY